MLGYQKIAERKIKEAEERGEFDNLPGKGKPMEKDDYDSVPGDLRIAYKILKNSNCLPPELELRKEIRNLEDMLENIPDEKEKYRQIKRINLKIMQMNMMGHKSPMLEEDQLYYQRIVEKFEKK
jgi:hypothetical protein